MFGGAAANSLGDLTVSCAQKLRMQANTGIHRNSETLQRATNRIAKWDPRTAARTAFADGVMSAAHGGVAVVASGHAAARRSPGNVAIPMRRGVGPDESHSLALSLPRGNGRAGLRGANFVVSVHRGHRTGARRARRPADNSAASAGSAAGTTASAGSAAGTTAPAGSAGGAPGSGSRCRAGAGSGPRAASGSRRSAGRAEFGGRSAGHQKRARDATRSRCAAEPASA
jgi:hypothetical protein